MLENINFICTVLATEMKSILNECFSSRCGLSYFYTVELIKKNIFCGRFFINYDVKLQNKKWYYVNGWIAMNTAILV